MWWSWSNVDCDIIEYTRTNPWLLLIYKSRIAVKISCEEKRQMNEKNISLIEQTVPAVSRISKE